MSTRKNVFERAADIIEKNGWCQGTLVNYAGCYCIVGALAQANTGGVGFIAAAPVTRRLRALLPEFRTQGLSSWNDHPERTKEHVLHVLKTAGRLAREKASRT